MKITTLQEAGKGPINEFMKDFVGMLDTFCQLCDLESLAAIAQRGSKRLLFLLTSEDKDILQDAAVLSAQLGTLEALMNLMDTRRNQLKIQRENPSGNHEIMNIIENFYCKWEGQL